MKRRGWLACVGLLLANAQAAEPEPLRAWVSTSWAPPFLMPETDGPRRGLIPDWYAALGPALGRPLQVSYLPPRRLAQEGAERQQDLRCFGSPAWVPAGVVSWWENAAQPFVSVDEVLVGDANSPLADSPARLQGRRIGTVAGYAYPTLAADFSSGRLVRDDAASELAMLRKQLQGRTDYAVIRRWTLEHLQRQELEWRPLRAMPLLVSSTDLFCGVRRGGSLPLSALEAAQDKLLRDGTLDRLLARHGLTR